MPIVITDYEWRQTEELVIVRVPLKELRSTKADVFTSETYIRLHCPPFIFECCLYDLINEDTSRCVISNVHAVFELAKIDKVPWPSLGKNLTKADMLKVKIEAIERSHAKAKEQNIKHIQKKNRVQKKSIEGQMKLNRNTQQYINQKRDDLRNTTMTEMEEYRQHYKRQEIEARSTKYFNKKPELPMITNGEQIPLKDPTQSVSSTKKPNFDSGDYPAPRGQVNIPVEFTPRLFPTPVRESALPQEEEWLKKQAERKRIIGFVEDDLRPEEQNPDWLLEKGRSFHRVENYLGAISAISHALRLNDQLPELYMERARAQIEIGNWHRVCEDTCTALDLYKPHVASNAEARYTCHKLRARALIHMGYFDAAICDLSEALYIHPEDEECSQLQDEAEEKQEAREKEYAERPDRIRPPPEHPGDIVVKPAQQTGPQGETRI